MFIMACLSPCSEVYLRSLECAGEGEEERGSWGRTEAQGYLEEVAGTLIDMVRRALVTCRC